MIIMKIGGGLGNQMFQYALGKKLAAKNNDELLLDISGFSIDTEAHYRPYRLSHFNIKARTATDAEAESVRNPCGKLVGKISRFIEWRILGHKHVKFEPHLLKKNGDIYLEGVFQSEKYFNDIRPLLLDDLSLKEPLSEDSKAIADRITAEPNTVSLHVRRGDYVETEDKIRRFSSYCTPDYYARGLRYLSEKKGQLSVFVFSDDIEWVKKNIPVPFSVTYVPDKCPDYEQVMLMSLCQDHIIANSTFSWWGAWLDKKADKTVIAPAKWIESPNSAIDDILPPEWTRI